MFNIFSNGNKEKGRNGAGKELVLKWRGPCLKGLVVESDHDYSEYLMTSLGRVKTTENTTFLELSNATNLREAIDKLERNTYDVIITEINLADASGFLVLDELVEFGRHTPVILITNTGSWERLIEDVESPIAECILKQDLTVEKLAKSILFSVKQRQLQDINAHREAEITAMMEVLPVGICIVGEENRCKTANKQFCQMLGVNLAKLQGREFPSLVERSFEATVSAGLKHARSAEKPVEIEIAMTKDDESNSEFLLLVDPVREGDNSENEELLVLCIDQTQQKKRIQERNESEVFRVLTDGLSNLAHELNNVLGQIKLDSENLSHSTQPEMTKQCLQRIENAVESARSTLRPFISTSQEMEPRLELLSSNKFLKGLVSEFQSQLPSRIFLETWISEHLPSIMGDAACLKRSILNLLCNAAESQSEKGSIRFSANPIEIQEDDPLHQDLDLQLGLYLVIDIRDKGCGIPSGQKTKVFEPFYSLNKTNHQGIGLTHVLKCMRNHNGNMKIESIENQGTTVQLFLPAASSKNRGQLDEGSATNQCTSACTARRFTVLLVDDEQDFLSAAEQLLLHLGYHVIPAESGLEALDLYQKRRSEIDLAVVDLTMPVMSGQELIKHLKAISPSLRVLLCTGHETHNALESVKNLDIDAVIYKPFSGDELNKALKRIIS